MFLSRPWLFAKEPVYGFLISLVLGCIFFDIPNDRRAAINARFGFIISILAIFLLPNLFIHAERGIISESKKKVFSFEAKVLFAVLKVFF